MNWRASEPIPPPPDPTRLGDALAEMDPAALRALAECYERIARTARERAGTLDERAERRAAIDNRLASFPKELPRLVMSHLAAGLPLDQAFWRASFQHHCPPETVAAYWKQFCKSRERQAVQSRTLFIVRRAL